VNVNGLSRNGEWKDGKRIMWVGALDEPKFNNLINYQYERTEVLQLNTTDRPSCETE
jgi:hypothetical protein